MNVFLCSKDIPAKKSNFYEIIFYKLNFHEPQSFREIRENSVANKIPRTALHFIHNVVDVGL